MFNCFFNGPTKNLIHIDPEVLPSLPQKNKLGHCLPDLHSSTFLLSRPNLPSFRDTFLVAPSTFNHMPCHTNPQIRKQCFPSSYNCDRPCQPAWNIYLIVPLSRRQTVKIRRRRNKSGPCLFCLQIFTLECQLATHPWICQDSRHSDIQLNSWLPLDSYHWVSLKKWHSWWKNWNPRLHTYQVRPL